MGEVNTSILGNVMYFCIPPISLYCILYSIFTHDYLKRYYLTALYSSFCLLMVCCLTTTSAVCVLRRKPNAVTKPLSRMYDSDLESESGEETLVVEENSLNPFFRPAVVLFRFCSSRRIYGLIAGVGTLFMITNFAISIVLFLEAPNENKDLKSTAVVLGVTLLALEAVVFIAAVIPKSWKPIKNSYKPFDESIRIPMTVFIAKFVALLYQSIPRLAVDVFYQFAAIYGLVTVFNMPEEEITRFVEATNVVVIHEIMICIMVVANTSGLYMLIECLATAWKLTEDGLLVTFEKNWERNLSAFDFLLPKEEVTTLEELRDALRNKTRQEQFTEEEEKALWYIGRPLWKSKRAFLDKPEGVQGKLAISLRSSAKESRDPSSPGPSGIPSQDLLQSLVRTPLSRNRSTRTIPYNLRSGAR